LKKLLHTDKSTTQIKYKYSDQKGNRLHWI